MSFSLVLCRRLVSICASSGVCLETRERRRRTLCVGDPCQNFHQKTAINRWPSYLPEEIKPWPIFEWGLPAFRRNALPEAWSPLSKGVFGERLEGTGPPDFCAPEAPLCRNRPLGLRRRGSNGSLMKLNKLNLCAGKEENSCCAREIVVPTPQTKGA